MSEASTPATPTPAPNGKRRLRLIVLAAVVVLGLVGWSIYWATIARHREVTDDAYVAGNVVLVSPQVGGTVISIAADDTQLVKQGDVLIEFDPADARIALDGAEAALAQAVRQVRNLRANTGGAEAAVRSRRIELQRAKDDLARRAGLDETGAVSTESVLHAREAIASAQANLAATEEQLRSAQSLVDDTNLSDHPEVLAAAAHVRDAYLQLHRTKLRSPITGYVAKRSVQLGQRVQAGAPMMAVIPLNNVWVDANFKEVQLRHIRIGQPVTLVSDLFGDDVEYHGRVAGLGAGTGSAFALLPAQNATGNWIKVVQRLPVRIELDAKQLAEHPLRVGLSMEARVDIHDVSGQVLAQTTNTTPAYQTNMYSDDLSAADQLISDIIRSNGGGTKSPAVAKVAE